MSVKPLLLDDIVLDDEECDDEIADRAHVHDDAGRERQLNGALFHFHRKKMISEARRNKGSTR